MTKVKHFWGAKTKLTMALVGSVSGLTVAPLLTHAESSQEIMAEKSKVDQNLTQLNKQIKDGNTQIGKQKADYHNTQKQLSDVGNSIKETKDRIAKRQDLMGQRLVAYQKSQDNFNMPYLGVLLDSQSFGDFVNRVVAVGTIMNADQDLINQQKEDMQTLNSQQQSLLDKKQELENQFQSLEQQQSELESKQAEQEALSTQLGNKLEKTKAAEEKAKMAEQLQLLQEQIFNVGSGFSGTLPSSKEMLINNKASKQATAVIAEASKYIGNPYVWGGSNPSTSFDCSGLTQWAFEHGAGISLPRTAAEQYLVTMRIGLSDLKPGDLIFFSYGQGIAHVGIYVGNWQMLDAQNNGIEVESLTWWEPYIAGFGRVLGVQDN